MTAKTHRAKSKSGVKTLKSKTLKVRKELSLFYKLGLFFILLASVAIFYFVIMVSTSPRSFPFVTQEIEAYLKENVGSDSKIGASQIKFTRYGTLRVDIDDLQVFYDIDKDNKQEFHIPRLEGEISLWNLISFNFVPSAVRIINPKIVIDNKSQNMDWEDANVIGKKDQTSIFSHILRAISDDYSGVEDFEIINAEFDIKGKTIDHKIVVKESRINVVEEYGKTTLHFVNRVNFDAKKPDVSFNANCNMHDEASLKCSVFLGKFNAGSVSTLHPKLAYLDEVDAFFDVIGSFSINSQGVDDVFFDVKSKQGRFEFLSFFSKAMDFKNLLIKGEFHKDLGIFAISDLKVDFPNHNMDSNDDYAHLSMSATFSNLQNQQEHQSDFDIKLKNVPNNDLDKFWPVTLAKGGIRQWVIQHFSGGIIEDAYANFTLKTVDQQTKLRDIKSRLVFSGLGLKYSDKFPEISDIKAVANFTKNDMNIDIVDGKVLDTRISDAKVSIDNFAASKVMLHINGQSKGDAADSLKHANNNNKTFVKEVDHYLNGQSDNFFDVHMPLTKKIGLKDVSIEVKSKITNLKNDYVRGGVTIVTKKGFGSSEFDTQFDFTKARIAYDPLDIYKEMAQESGLDVTISFAKPNQITFKDFLLWKRNVEAKNSASEIRAAFVIDTNYGNLSSLTLENSHFGENDYSLTYKKDNLELSQELNIKGKAINLGPLIENKFSFIKSQSKTQIKTQGQARDKILHSSYKIAVKKLGLANDKFIDGFSFALHCDNNFCHRGFMIGNYDDDDYVSINTSKDPNDILKVEGRLTNIGYLADAFNISDLLSAAKVDVKLTNELQNGSQRLSGDILVDGKITIYETPIVKKLERDNLFSAVRDKIFSSNKVVFDSMKINLALQDNVLTINSLLANNYKIGITAKGKVDLSENSYDLKGMIIPGYTINNLFGIGKIPVIGNVVTGVLTGGQQEGGIFGIRYEYVKNKDDVDPTFKTNKVSAFVPTTIRNLFDKL